LAVQHLNSRAQQKLGLVFETHLKTFLICLRTKAPHSQDGNVFTTRGALLSVRSLQHLVHKQVSTWVKSLSYMHVIRSLFFEPAYSMQYCSAQNLHDITETHYSCGEAPRDGCSEKRRATHLVRRYKVGLTASLVVKLIGLLLRQPK